VGFVARKRRCSLFDLDRAIDEYLEAVDNTNALGKTFAKAKRKSGTEVLSQWPNDQSWDKALVHSVDPEMKVS